MDNDKYIEDLAQIRDIMNRSTRFRSLGGLSGVFAGIFALIGVYIAYRSVYMHWDPLEYEAVSISREHQFLLLINALITITLSFSAVIFFSAKEAKKRDQKLWDVQSRRALINFFLPLVVGGIVCLMFLFRGYLGLVAPLTLIFYGLALVNTSKYTFGEVFVMGVAELILGLMAMQWIAWGLWIWALGFGVLNIASGWILHKKYST